MRPYRRVRPLALLAAGLAAMLVSTKPAMPAADPNATDALMLRLMAADNVPGAALALIADGKIVLEKGYGFRDLASGAPVTTATLFNIGSISKSFTTLDILQLADRGQVDLDAPVMTYSPDLRLADGQAARTVTLRQLLSHSSGFPPDERWPSDVPPTREGIVGEFAGAPVTATPGTRFQYCSRCIVLAAHLLEHVTGRSWEAYTRAHIFVPLGMATAAFGPGGLRDAADRAQPYRHDPILGEVPVPWSRIQFLAPLAPGGGIDASIDDMARYALLQVGDGSVSGVRIASPRTIAELHRPEIAVGKDWDPAAEAKNLHSALGWFTADIGGAHLVFHNGANPGFRATIVLVPSAKAALVILTNGESDAFVRAAAQGLLKQLL